MKMLPMPSPRGTNFEGLQVPSYVLEPARHAMDAALAKRYGSLDQDPVSSTEGNEKDRRFRDGIEAMKGGDWAGMEGGPAALDMVLDLFDACYGKDESELPSPEEETHAANIATEDQEEGERDREEMEGEDMTESASEEGASTTRRFPESGNPAPGDRRRSARDARPMGMDAADVFNQMFGTSRIRNADDLR